MEDDLQPGLSPPPGAAWATRDGALAFRPEGYWYTSGQRLSVDTLKQRLEGFFAELPHRAANHEWVQSSWSFGSSNFTSHALHLLWPGAPNALQLLASFMETNGSSELSGLYYPMDILRVDYPMQIPDANQILDLDLAWSLAAAAFLCHPTHPPSETEMNESWDSRNHPLASQDGAAAYVFDFGGLPHGQVVFVDAKTGIVWPFY